MSINLKDFRLSPKHVLVIILLVIHLAPIWMFRYFPSQDGQNHIYNAYVLKEYHKHENYRLREVFKLNLTLFPNWTSHVLMALLMYIFPPIICEKILLTLCVVLPPLSLFYFLKAIDRDKMLFGFLGFIYAYNYLLHMGFYNFALSVPIFFFTLGYWWKHKDEMDLAKVGVLYILLFLTYFCHFQSYLQVVLCISLSALFSSLYSASARTWGHRRDGQESPVSLRDFTGGLKPFLVFLGYMLPSYLIMLSYSLSSTRGYGSTYKTFEELRGYFMNMKSLVYFRDNRILIGHLILCLLAVAFLLTLWGRIRDVRRSDASTERLWMKIINREDQFLLMAVILTVIFFKVPYYLHSGGAWINDRVHIYIFLVLLPFFSIGFHKYIRYAIVGIIIALSLWHLGYNVHDHYYLSKDIAEMTAARGMVEEHATLTGRPLEWGGLSDRLGAIEYVAPFFHVGSYLCLNNGAAYLPNYEADYDYFPINFKNEPETEDYVLLWKTEYGQIEELEEEGYVLVHSGKYNKLYRLEKARPDESLWGNRDVIEFDMQSRDGQTAPGHIPVFDDTVYTDGSYGWVTVSEREEFRSESDVPEPYRDGVQGEEDGVFRVALPNGTYTVTCYFGPGEPVENEINIIANGKKVIRNLRIPIGDETIGKSYTIAIADERLTQIIYTRWRWSGCRIERTQ